MTNQKKSSVISRLNSNWEATVTISLPLPVLNKIAQKAAKAGRKPVDYMKSKVIEILSEKEIEKMKNLGVTKVIRKNKTRIERTLSEGTFSVERDESVLIPLPIFIAAWKQLKSAVSKELLGEENDFEIEELTSVEFRIAQIEDDPNDVQLSSIICKGRLFLERHTDFANAHFYDENSLKIATQLYVAAADYFDGKNAQMEFLTTKE